jgi:alkylhydroperoxidase/carboxymuconolactone decarboxylase family protein YurZ
MSDDAANDNPPALLPQHAIMRDLDLDLFERYRHFRGYFYEERPDGLELPMKELLFIAINAAIGNLGGALNHVESAKAAGVTRSQLAEALSLALLLAGAQSWVNVGSVVSEAWDAADS